MRSTILLLFCVAVSGCASRSALMPLDDWITQTLISVDSGVRGQTKFVYAGSANAKSGEQGSVALTVTGVGSGELNLGAPASFYVLVQGKIAGSETRTVELKLDPLPGVAQARTTTGRAATVIECESGGFLDKLFGDGKIHVLRTRQLPFGR